MIVKEISATIATRVNTGNYEGTEVISSMTADVEEFDDPAECQKALHLMCEEAQRMKLTRLYSKKGRKITAEQVRKLHGV